MRSALTMMSTMNPKLPTNLTPPATVSASVAVQYSELATVALPAAMDSALAG
jgi:hypothetical protein